MSKITIDRSVLKQALALLETPIHFQPFGMRQDAITALRAALAEVEQQVDPLLVVLSATYEAKK